ncbi:hypothetical protein GVAV_003384 [Gurleya vavrai]
MNNVNQRNVIFQKNLENNTNVEIITTRDSSIFTSIEKPLLIINSGNKLLVKNKLNDFFDQRTNSYKVSETFIKKSPKNTDFLSYFKSLFYKNLTLEFDFTINNFKIVYENRHTILSGPLNDTCFLNTNQHVLLCKDFEIYKLIYDEEIRIIIFLNNNKNLFEIRRDQFHITHQISLIYYHTQEKMIKQEASAMLKIVLEQKQIFNEKDIINYKNHYLKTNLNELNAYISNTSSILFKTIMDAKKYLNCDYVNFESILELIIYNYELFDFSEISRLSYENHYQFFEEKIKCISHKALIFQPSIFMFLYYECGDKNNNNYFKSSKDDFVFVCLCLILNLVATGRWYDIYYAKKNNHFFFQDKKWAVNYKMHIFTTFNLLFAKIFAYCLTPFVSKELIKNFVHLYMLENMEATRKKINIYPSIFIRIKYFINTLIKYKFISKFIFCNDIEFKLIFSQNQKKTDILLADFFYNNSYMQKIFEYLNKVKINRLVGCHLMFYIFTMNNLNVFKYRFFNLNEIFSNIKTEPRIHDNMANEYINLNGELDLKKDLKFIENLILSIFKIDDQYYDFGYYVK